MSLSTALPAIAPAELPAVVPAYASEQGIDAELLEMARIRLELLYGEVAASWSGFIARPGQYQMMQACLLTFFSAKVPDDEDRSGNNLAQLEAGTGTGKTVAYCLAAIVACELLKKSVIISTATVALQEQLFQKDLPRLAEIIPDLRYDILKGRARYVCESRLEGVINDVVQDSLLTVELQESFADARWQARGSPREQPTLHRLLFAQPRRNQTLAHHRSLAKEAGVLSGRHCCIRFIYSLSAVSIQLYALPIVAAHHGPGCRRYWIDVLGVPAFAAHLDQWLEVACGDHETSQGLAYDIPVSS